MHKQRTQRISCKLVGEPMKFSLYPDLVWNKFLFKPNRKRLFACIVLCCIFGMITFAGEETKGKKERFGGLFAKRLLGAIED